LVENSIEQNPSEVVGYAITLAGMDREAAEHEAARLAAGHPHRETHRFLAREQQDGSWAVVKVGLPPLGELTAETRAEERPPTPDDPRTVSEQNLGPNVGPVL
jgi:hypothetical protein